MKNKKGFTLVELLSTIVILAILLSASVFAITKFVGKSKVESMEAQKRAFVMAGKSYAQDHSSVLPNSIGEKKDIYANVIKTAKYLKNDLTNADGKSCMEKSFVRVYKYDETGYTYTAYIFCEGDTVPTEIDPVGPDIHVDFSYPDDAIYANVTLTDGSSDGDIIGLMSWDYTVVAHYKESDTTVEVYHSESMMLNGETNYTADPINLSSYEDADKVADFDIIITAYNRNGGFSSTHGINQACASLSLDITSIYILKGETKQIEATKNCGKSVQWTSSNDNVVTISEDGVITGVGAGEATITATLPGGIVAEASVEVGVCTSVSLTPNSFTLRRGSTQELSVNKDCRNPVSWSSSNPSVASVADGVITGIAPGNAVITATLIDGVTSTSSVNICAPSIQLNQSSVSVTQGGTTTVTATKSCTDSNVTWTSSNPSVATVNNGVITGVSAGDAVVTATVEDASKTVNVTVPTCSYLHLSDTSLSVQKGKTKTITVEKDCANPVTWTSSNPSVVTVENGVLTGVTDGNAVITATLMDGITETVNVNVCTPTISVSPASITIKEGETKQITATTTCTTSAVTWKSSSTSNATVSSSGVIRGVNHGSARVTATVDGVSARVNVTVQLTFYYIGG